MRNTRSGNVCGNCKVRHTSAACGLDILASANSCADQALRGFHFADLRPVATSVIGFYEQWSWPGLTLRGTKAGSKADDLYKERGPIAWASLTSLVGARAFESPTLGPEPDVCRKDLLAVPRFLAFG